MLATAPLGPSTPDVPPDSAGTIENMGIDNVEQIRKNAQIAKANAQRDIIGSPQIASAPRASALPAPCVFYVNAQRLRDKPTLRQLQRQISSKAHNGNHHCVDGFSTGVDTALHRNVRLDTISRRNVAISTGCEDPERVTDIPETLAHATATKAKKIRTGVDTQAPQEFDRLRRSVNHCGRNRTQNLAQ